MNLAISTHMKALGTSCSCLESFGGLSYCPMFSLWCRAGQLCSGACFSALLRDTWGRLALGSLLLMKKNRIMPGIKEVWQNMAW